jgi:nitroreductase
MMSLGCVMENMWLMAQALGIGFHVLSVFSSEAVESELQKILGIPQFMKVGFACRLGDLTPQAGKYLRVCRDLSDFVHHNRFGERGL